MLTKIDGKTVKSMEDVIRVVDSKEPGDEVTLTLMRGKDERTVKVTLGSRPANAGSGFQQPDPQTPQSPESAAAARALRLSDARAGQDLWTDPP